MGGRLLTGGYGNAVGVAIGAFIFGMTNQGIVYAGWDPNWFRAFLGIMLLMAVVVNLYVKKLDNAESGLTMTDTITEHADPKLHKGEALVEMQDVGKAYGAIRALRGVNLKVRAGEVYVRPRRQRRRQVHSHQDHRRAAPAQRGTSRSTGRRWRSSRRETPLATGSPPSTRTWRSSA